jgi:transcriptional regulator with XRE-family HTH domain
LNYNKIKQFRTKRRLTQSQLANKAGISQSVLSDIENGKVNPTVPTLYKIAKALNVDMNKLLELDTA